MTVFCVLLVIDQPQTKANGVVRQGRRHGPSNTCKITPCFVNLLQQASKQVTTLAFGLMVLYGERSRRRTKNMRLWWKFGDNSIHIMFLMNRNRTYYKIWIENQIIWHCWGEQISFDNSSIIRQEYEWEEGCRSKSVLILSCVHVYWKFFKLKSTQPSPPPPIRSRQFAVDNTHTGQEAFKKINIIL